MQERELGLTQAVAAGASALGRAARSDGIAATRSLVRCDVGYLRAMPGKVPRQFRKTTEGRAGAPDTVLDTYLFIYNVKY